MKSEWHEMLNDSYERCFRRKDLFLDTFYKNFLSKSPEIIDRFRNTDMDSQKTMLANSIPMMLFAYSNPSELSDIMQSHASKERNITPEMFVMWIDSLVEAVGECDPNFNMEIETVWRAMMDPGIELMRERTECDGGLVLAVDDVDMNRQIIGIYLSKMSIRHKVFSTGADLLSFYKKRADEVTLILTDVHMPKYSGIDMTLDIRKFEKENNLKPVPITAVTADDKDLNREKCMESGMTNFMIKPIGFQSILTEVTQYCCDDQSTPKD
jgi:CheY-like chemotaxis protein